MFVGAPVFDVGNHIRAHGRTAISPEHAWASVVE